MTFDKFEMQLIRSTRGLVALAVLLSACGGGGSKDSTPTTPTPPTLVLTTVNVALTPSTVQIGQTSVASASGLDQNGGSITMGAVTWSSTSPATATVSVSGVVTGVAVGQAQIIAAAGGKQGLQVITVVPVPVASITVAPSAQTLAIGATQQFTATTVDATGGLLSGRVITWSSSDLTKVTINAVGIATAVASGSATITATSEGKTGTAAITVSPPPVASVTVAPTSASLFVGGTQQLTATTSDASNNTLTGRVIVWTSSDATKATVSTTGLVTAVAVGSATISATSEGKVATSAITVNPPPPVATVTVAPATATIAVGGSVVLTATAKDASGNILSGRVFTWSSSNLSIAGGSFVANVQTTTGIGVGTATLTATSEGKSGAATVTVIAAAPLISSVSPTTLTPAGTITITGTGFAAVTASNTVTIGGISAPLLSGSTTQLTATVPCLVSGTVPVVVSIAGANSNSVNASLVGTTQTLAVGQSVALLTEAAVRCNELAVTGGRYLISIFNTSTAPSANTPVVIRGASVAPGSSASAAPSVQFRPLDFGRDARSTRTPEMESREANARAHSTMMERDRANSERLRRSPGYASALSVARTRASVSALVVPPTVGSNVTLRYGGFTSSSCNTFSSISARVVAVTTHSIVLEDNTSPTAGQVDADLSALGQLFESTLYGIEANFGDINAWDVPGGLDNPGRVLMLFTPSENQPFPGGGILLGHVTGCDMYPTALTGAAGSNQTKIFYARVPKFVSGAATTLDTRAWWNTHIPGTLVHEAKHITSNAERFSRGLTAFEDSWLEEATAQIASEFYSRSVYPGTTWKGNTTYLNSLFCDARLGSAQCPGAQVLMQNHFSFLQNYFENNESKSILSAETVDPDILGSGWMFVRWLVDQYGGPTESTLLRSLVQEGNLAGVANVTAKTGVPFANLLADWTMSLVADDYPGFTPPAGAKYTFPSWNTRSIWSGFNTDFGPNNPVFPLQESFVSFGAFNLSVSLPGAAARIIELSGSQLTKQLLDLSGLAPGTTIRMSILRVQ